MEGNYCRTAFNKVGVTIQLRFMLKRKVLFCTSAMVVIAAGVFATGNKAKRLDPAALWVSSGSSGCVQVASAGISSLFTLTGLPAQQAQIVSKGGNPRPVYENNGCSTRVYFD